MIWNGVLKIHIYCTLVFITFCAGCGATISDLKSNAESYVDLSDPSVDKAQLRAAKWDVGIAGGYCYMTAPAHAERVTVNAGTVDVSVVCEEMDGEKVTVSRATFSFDALAGHNYVITKHYCDRCVKLTDETTKKMVDRFYMSGSLELKLTNINPDAALIREGRASEDKGNCFPTREGYYLMRRFFEIDAGPIKIDAICSPTIFGGPRIASFDFVGEAGHIYTMTVTDKKCISLIDITSEEVVIACEPHQKIDKRADVRKAHYPLARFADLSTGDNTADIKASTAPRCEFTDKHVNHLIVDAGTVTVDSTCTIPTLNFFSNRESRVRSSFHFDAETGHSYMIELYRPLGKDKCMQLLDITSEDITIACEPFEKVE